VSLKHEPVSVVISSDEVAQACTTGCIRNWTANSARDHKSSRDPANSWGINIEGAAAEIAVARTLGQYWTGAIFDGDQNRADVGSKIGVRWTNYKDGHLILKESDSIEIDYVLVTGAIPNFQIRGYINGKDAKTDERFIRVGQGNEIQFWIPQEHLQPIPKKWINEQGQHKRSDI
jgi:hypothetical protein